MEEINGGDQLGRYWARIFRGTVGGVSYGMAGSGEGVGEERAGTVGERGDDVADAWRACGWPRGVAGA